MKIKQSQLMNRAGARRPQNIATTQGGDFNIYEPQSTMPAFQRRMPVTTWIRDTFFPGVHTFPTKHVLMDFYKNRQRVAPYVAENSKSINIKRDGFRTDIYTAPFINISRPYDVDLLQNRQFAEQVFNSPTTPQDRAIALMQRDYNELDDMITRREELQVAELLQTGIVTITGYVDDTATVVRTDRIDYGFENIINLTGTSQWDGANPNMLGDLDEAAALVRSAGYNPDFAMFGKNAAWNFLQDEKILKLMDYRRADFGSLAPDERLVNGNGYTYLGRLRKPGIDLFQYDAFYYDDTTEDLHPYIDPDRVVVGSRNLGEMLYGAITQIPENSDNFVTYEGSRVPKVTIDRNSDTKSLLLKSRPVPLPYDVAAWAVINTKVKP
ncbi:major capsid protein [Paenibacillus daejeonensis]|uniref:major capsid protein n=1 Tax=Paenibacillus daejeonensis TaxID=135193 RepID=UPI00035FDAB4|nr:major capsid protein [Paenibacillus daejeonensis]